MLNVTVGTTRKSIAIVPVRCARRLPGDVGNRSRAVGDADCQLIDSDRLPFDSRDPSAGTRRPPERVRRRDADIIGKTRREWWSTLQDECVRRNPPDARSLALKSRPTCAYPWLFQLSPATGRSWPPPVSQLAAAAVCDQRHLLRSPRSGREAHGVVSACGTARYRFGIIPIGEPGSG
jgi:hypothetical protein